MWIWILTRNTSCDVTGNTADNKRPEHALCDVIKSLGGESSHNPHRYAEDRHASKTT